jgi:tRNA threonylcarbamoyladenosine biosynthesis protein TsaB
MRVLAIDTALAACAAAVFESDGGRTLAAESLAMARGHAEALMPLIARVMDKAETEFAELDRIGVTVGPGSFTGLRVGISAALASGKPAVGLSNLSAYAAPHIAQEDGAAVVVAIDARHGHVYLQVFASTGRTLIAPVATTVAEAVHAALPGSARIVGSGAALLAADWPAEALPPLLIDAQDAPAIEWVARIGAAARADTAPTPLYLRPPDARPQDGARLPRR